MEHLPPEAILADAPPPMRDVAERLRGVIVRTLPGATERVRPGWRIIGYDVPITPRRSAYFAWIMIQREHVHLGFPHGVLMADPRRILEGAGITKRARWTTMTPEAPIPEAHLAELLQEAARVAGLPTEERLAIAAARAGDQP